MSIIQLIERPEHGVVNAIISEDFLARFSEEFQPPFLGQAAEASRQIRDYGVEMNASELRQAT